MKAEGKTKKVWALLLTSVLFGTLFFVALNPVGTKVFANGESKVQYTREAVLIDEEAMPGVYQVKAEVGDSKDKKNGEEPAPDTIGIPSIAKQNLADHPTQESPAIIMGAAVNYEEKTGPTEYKPFVPGTERIAPYSYFRYGIVDEQIKEPDGSITTHQKLTGFDGSYYIVRVDVSEIIANIKNPEGKYLHVRQDDNKALMVAVGQDRSTYSNGMGSKTGAYSLANAAAALKDTGANDLDKETPYFDVILYSSGKLTAGADATTGDVPKGDVKLSFYVDDTEDYNPAIKPLDPNNMPTFPYSAPDGVQYQTETDYNNALLEKFYREKAEAKENEASYLVKGEDLEIDVTVDEQDPEAGASTKPDFWSLTNAMDHQAYDGHIIKLICEVPVLVSLSIESKVPGEERNVILDVNSFDIQVANSNTETSKAGIRIAGGATLEIQDGTNTSGAELAIGNNATMVVENGGTLVVDESCTAEVEYDAGTVPAGEAPPDYNIGEITIEEGGMLINNGVVNIEGAESKPVQPGQQDQPTVSGDIKRADMFVNKGGVFTNYGCLSLKGDLYVLGTLRNYGKYNDVIEAHDPDKGTTSYHKGIQLTWKDVVTAPGVEPGALYVGCNDPDPQKAVIEKSAVVENYGDIVLAPGVLNLYGTFKNLENENYNGHLYLCAMDEAIIPVIDPNDPLHVEDRIVLDPPKESVFNHANGTVVTDKGVIDSARVELLHNGVLGVLIPSAEEINTAKGLLETAKTSVKNAEEAIAALTEESTKEQVEAAYKTLVTAQTDLSAAQNRLSKAEKDQEKVELEKLQIQVSQLAEELAEISVVDITNFAASLPAESYEYTGKEIRPTVTVSGLGAEDFSVIYENNKAIGTAKVTIEGKAERNFKGKIEKTFRITKKAGAVSAKAGKKTYSVRKLRKASKTFSLASAVKVSGAKGKVSFSAKAANKKSKKALKVKNGKVTVKKRTKKGTYKLKVSVKDSGTAYDQASSKTVTLLVRVK